MEKYQILVSLCWLAIVSLPSPSEQLENGLARTPPMGWLAWERYVCETNCKLYPGECIDAKLFLEMADRMVADGFQQVGYEYVNIDDCWSKREREQNSSQLLADPDRFPLGLRALADELHSRNLKLGIYGDCGSRTCQNFPGQLRYADNLTDNYFQLDADSFAAWQLDSFKFDGCYLNVSRASAICPLMEAALNKTQRPILFSCSWPAYENDEHLETNWTLVVERCNLWRAFGDIEDSWKSVLETIDYFVRKQDIVAQFHGPGHWFDADMLVIGDFGLSLEQERAQMAIWCIWSAPLYMSNDLRQIGKESSKILRNKWAISVNQDPLGVFGLMVLEWHYLQVFAKPIEPLDADSCPNYALVYLDRRTLGNGKLNSFKLATILGNLHQRLSNATGTRWANWSHCANRTQTQFAAHDLFNGFAKIGPNLKLVSDALELRVNPSGVRMVQLVPVEAQADNSG